MHCSIEILFLSIYSWTISKDGATCNFKTWRDKSVYLLLIIGLFYSKNTFLFIVPGKFQCFLNKKGDSAGYTRTTTGAKHHTGGNRTHYLAALGRMLYQMSYNKVRLSNMPLSHEYYRLNFLLISYIVGKNNKIWVWCDTS